MNQTEKMRKALRKVVELIQYQYTGSMKAMSALQDAANAAEEALAAEPAEEAQPFVVEKFTALMVGENHGLIAPFGSEFKGSPEHYQRITVYTNPTPEAVRKLPRLTDEEIKHAMLSVPIYGFSLMQMLRDDVDVEIFRKALIGIANAIMDAMEAKAALDAVRSGK